MANDGKPPVISDSVKGAIVAAVLAGAVSGGASIYSAGSWHATTEYHLNDIDNKLVDIKNSANSQSEKVNQAATVAAAAAGNTPRVEALEKAQATLTTNLAVLGQKVDTVTATVASHGVSIDESVDNTRILIDKLAPESARPHGHRTFNAPR